MLETARPGHSFQEQKSQGHVLGEMEPVSKMLAGQGPGTQLSLQRGAASVADLRLEPSLGNFMMQ